MKLLGWILRTGTCLTFTGHGLVALTVEPQWLKYLLVTGMSQNLAETIMPYIGALDLLVALVILIRPLGVVLVWAVFWAFITALIRPLAGEGWLAFVERGANWAAPLALVMLQYYQKPTAGNRSDPVEG